MSTTNFRIIASLSMVTIFVFGSANCEISLGQAAEVSSLRGPVDKPANVAANQTPSLLRQPHIKRDLELTQEQIDQLTEVSTRHNSMIREMMADYRTRVREMEPGQRREYMRDVTEKRKQSQKDMEDQINDILLPFQVKRMEQIKVQNQLARMGRNAGSQILHPIFRDKLNFDKEQEERIKKKMQEVQKKLAEDIDKLRKKASEEILPGITFRLSCPFPTARQ